MNCCDEYGNCNQGRDCPIRKERVRQAKELLDKDTTTNAQPAPVQEPVAALIDENQRLRAELKFNTLPAQPAPVQEPVATLWQHGETGRTRVTMPGDITDCDARWFKASDLYTSPPEPNQFKPDYNTEAVLVEEMQRMAKRIEDLEAKLRSKNT